jgi:threonine aldolase
VGDDQFGEDPTTNRLQERVAELLGKPAALWLPSGTMANQVALRVLTRPGDDVIVSRESHAVWHETGGSAANSGVQFTEVGARGVYTADDLRAACKPRGHDLSAATLLEIGNTHNRSGGVVFPQVMSSPCVLRANSVASSSTALAWERTVASAGLAGVCRAVRYRGGGSPDWGAGRIAACRFATDRARRACRMFGGAMRQPGSTRPQAHAMSTTVRGSDDRECAVSPSLQARAST